MAGMWIRMMRGIQASAAPPGHTARQHVLARSSSNRKGQRRQRGGKIVHAAKRFCMKHEGAMLTLKVAGAIFARIE
jgi:hypothetical protein